MRPILVVTLRVLRVEDARAVGTVDLRYGGAAIIVNAPLAVVVSYCALGEAEEINRAVVRPQRVTLGIYPCFYREFPVRMRWSGMLVVPSVSPKPANFADSPAGAANQEVLAWRPT